MQKVRIFLERVQSMSFKRMFRMIKQIQKEYKKNPVVTFIDMVFCALTDNIGYQDYRVFGFANIKYSDRKTFLNMTKNLELVRRVNHKNSYETYRDKTLFLEKYNKYIKRDWINLKNKSSADLRRFCKNKETIFVKTPDSFGGQGIGEIKITPYTNFDVLFNELIANSQTLVEEKIVQHEKMSSLHPSSINTVRVVTLKKDGQVHILSRILRMGIGGKVVDNITSGGIYVPLDEKGEIRYPAFCDKTGESFNIHPTSKVFLAGFKVPYFEEVIRMVTAISEEEEDMNYVGWDVAVTPDGPVIVEGNNTPSYEILQNYLHREGSQGILPEIEKILGEKL